MRNMLCVVGMLAGLGGCGVVFGPAYIAGIAKANEKIAVGGTVIDEEGRPVPDAVVSVEAAAEQFDALTGVKNVDTERAWVVGGDFHVEETAAYGRLALTVTKPGYYSRIPRFGTVEEVRATARLDVGEPRTALRVVMMKQGRLTTLETIKDKVWLYGDGSRVAVSPVAARLAGPVKKIGAGETVPDGWVYVSAERDARGIVPIQMGEHKQPAGLTLGIAGEGNGLQVYRPRRKEDVAREMKEAPESGYVREVKFDENQQADIAKGEDVWFYIKVNGQYGRGKFGTGCTCADHKDAYTQFEADVELFMQRDGSRNLETGE